MNMTKSEKKWLDEENKAQIEGWDFSYIDDRTEQTELPWDYREVIGEYLKPDSMLLDIDTGGGEFLLTLNHPFARTACTEAYPPNVKLCRERLLPLQIDFREAIDRGNLPFSDNSFDIIINRHGEYNCSELHRILKPGGIFITQQVGENNDYELVKMLLPESCGSFADWNLKNCVQAITAVGLNVLRQEEAKAAIRFYDVGALVWFARVIEWEFVGFSVKRCLEQLRLAQQIISEQGYISGTIHRFLIVAQKNNHKY